MVAVRHAFALRFLLVVFGVSLGAIGAHAGVLIVAPGGQYPQIQAAIDAASPDDVLLVKTGNYAPITIDGKPLRIFADTAHSVTITGTSTVRNLAAGQTLVLSGLIYRGVTSSATTTGAGVGLILSSNAGFVRVQGCEISGANGFGDGMTGSGYCCDLPLHDNGWDAVRVDACSKTSFTDCTIRGGRGANAYWYCICGRGDTGGVGLFVANSMISIHDSTLQGGAGGANGSDGGPGGAGLHVFPTGGVVASNSFCLGGDGGAGYDYIYSLGGTGGTGVVVESGAALQHIGCTFAGGAGGLSCGHVFPPGADGVPTGGSGAQYPFLVPSAALETALVAREGTLLSVTVLGAIGATASLKISRQPTFQPIPSQRGVVLVQQPIPAPHMLLGTIPGTGTLQTSFALPQLAAGAASSTYYLQVVIRDDVDGLTLGTSTALLVLDLAY